MSSKSSAKQILLPSEVEAFSKLLQMKEWASTAALAGLRLEIALARSQYVERFGFSYSSLMEHLHEDLVTDHCISSSAARLLQRSTSTN